VHFETLIFKDNFFITTFDVTKDWCLGLLEELRWDEQVLIQKLGGPLLLISHCMEEGLLIKNAVRLTHFLVDCAH